MRKKLISLILAVGLSISIAGCGQQSDSTANKGNTTATPNKSVTKVKVAVTNNAVPFDYLDSNGKPTGYDVDVLKKVDEKLPQYEFEISALEQTAVLLGVESGKFDIGASNFFKNPDREAKFLFPDENADLSLVKLVVKKDRNDINSLEDVSGKKLVPIAANDGLYTIIKDYNTANPGKQIELGSIESGTRADFMKWVASGKYDAYLCPEVGFNAVQKELNLDLKLTDNVKKVPTYFILNKNKTDLKSDIDKALKELKDEGTLSELSAKWFEKDVFKE